jgi:hypothetical protein
MIRLTAAGRHIGGAPVRSGLLRLNSCGEGTAAPAWLNMAAYFSDHQPLSPTAHSVAAIGFSRGLLLACLSSYTPPLAALPCLLQPGSHPPASSPPFPGRRRPSRTYSPGQAQRAPADSSISLALASSSRKLDAPASPTATLTLLRSPASYAVPTSSTPERHSSITHQAPPRQQLCPLPPSLSGRSRKH